MPLLLQLEVYVYIHVYTQQYSNVCMLLSQIETENLPRNVLLFVDGLGDLDLLGDLSGLQVREWNEATTISHVVYYN